MTASLVVLGIPSGDRVQTDFAMSLAQLCMQPGAPICMVNARSSLIAVGRNQLVGAAQIVKGSHILFLDTDMTFPADTLSRLLSHDKDIVGATYSRRTPPFVPMCEDMDGKPAAPVAGLQRVKLIPTGCLLVRVSVFDKMEKPYFNLSIEGEQLRGEDFFFCEAARRAGFDLWCDGDLSAKIGHIGQQIFRIGDQATRQQQAL